MDGEEMNEMYEFIRILLYILAAALLVQVGTVVKKSKLALYGVSLQFSIRAGLLVIQIASPDTYRELNNYISTPLLFVVVLALVANVWAVRKD